MQKVTEDNRLIVRCAQMYYEQGVSQVDISVKLGISKSTVSRILARAKEIGVVKFTVQNPLENDYYDLENKLENLFGLSEVIIVKDEPTIEQLKESLAKTAAKFLERVIATDMTVGVTWGTTVSKVSKYIEKTRSLDVDVIPLTGGMGSVVADIHPNQIATNIAARFRKTAQLLHAPGMVNDIQIKKTFLSEDSINEITNKYNDIDIILTGIGSPRLNTSTMIASRYYNEEQLVELVSKGAVADIGSLLIDKNGDGSMFESNNRVIGISLEQIKNAKMTIGISGGPAKTKAIHAALKGGYVNVLIVDAFAARQILQEQLEENHYEHN